MHSSSDNKENECFNRNSVIATEEMGKNEILSLKPKSKNIRPAGESSEESMLAIGYEPATGGSPVKENQSCNDFEIEDLMQDYVDNHSSMSSNEVLMH